MANKTWKVQKTLLIVGEGYHDEAFLNHVKRLPGACGNGVRITIKNAHGKGALNVIDYAEKLSRNFGYDHVAALFDADTDWTTKAAQKAKQAKIQVLLATPCLEAMLLRCIGRIPGDPHQLKDQLAPLVGNTPGKPESYETNFNLAALQAVRYQESTINDLLLLFNL
jgi:hypothetical protein